MSFCDLHSSLRRAVSKRTFNVSKRTFVVSKRTFAVSKLTVLTGFMPGLNNEIDTLSRFELHRPNMTCHVAKPQS